MSDNITLPREVVEKAIKAFENGCPPTCKNGMIDSGGFSPWGEPILEPCPACLAFEHLRAALAAPRPEPEPVPEPATDAKLLLAYRQRGCGFYMEFKEIWQVAERFHGIVKEVQP